LLETVSLLQYFSKEYISRIENMFKSVLYIDVSVECRECVGNHFGMQQKINKRRIQSSDSFPPFLSQSISSFQFIMLGVHIKEQNIFLQKNTLSAVGYSNKVQILFQVNCFTHQMNIFLY
jgi:hypothetical protein